MVAIGDVIGPIELFIPILDGNDEAHSLYKEYDQYWSNNPLSRKKTMDLHVKAKLCFSITKNACPLYKKYMNDLQKIDNKALIKFMMSCSNQHVDQAMIFQYQDLYYLALIN